MVRRLILALFASLALLLTALAGPASAAPTTTTFHEKGLVETFPDIMPQLRPRRRDLHRHHQEQPGRARDRLRGRAGAQYVR